MRSSQLGLFRNPHILKNRQAGENAAFLKCPGDPQPDNFMGGFMSDVAVSVEDLSGTGWQPCRDYIEKSGLPCPVRTNDGPKLIFRKRQVDFMDRGHAAKMAGEIFDG